jgi:arylsulfatase A-like enzyme
MVVVIRQLFLPLPILFPKRLARRRSEAILKYSVCILLVTLSALSVFASATQLNNPPNLIVIVVDDQRWDEYGAAGHPYLKTPNIDRLAEEGASFTSAYAVSPLCSPNRASILTGQYISRHGIVDNIARDESSHRLDLFAKALKQAGYKTAHVGKWHMGNDPSPRPGYDYWVSYAGQGRSLNPVLFENGRSAEVGGYLTDILTDRAVSFVEQEHEKPFFLYLGHKALHPEVKQRDDSTIDVAYGSKYLAAERHTGIYKDSVYPRRLNATSKAAIADKPVLEEVLAYKNSEAMGENWQSILDKGTSEKTIRDRAEMLLAVDEGLGRLLAALEAKGILETTAVILTSDNGYYYGEHGLSIERRMPYEEGVHVPLLLRYPKLVPPGQKVEQFALSVDIAPTLLELAQVQIGPQVQGSSLLGLFAEEPRDWRDSFLIEYVSYEKPMPWMIDTSYKVIRKGSYKYIHWIQHEGKDELYDLANDEYEMNNLIDEPGQQGRIAELRKELGLLVAEAIGL